MENYKSGDKILCKKDSPIMISGISPMFTEGKYYYIFEYGNELSILTDDGDIMPFGLEFETTYGDGEKKGETYIDYDPFRYNQTFYTKSEIREIKLKIIKK